MMCLNGPKGNETPTPLLSAGKFSRVAGPFGGEEPGLGGWGVGGGSALIYWGGQFLLLGFCSFWTHWASCLCKDNALCLGHHLFPSPHLASFTSGSNTVPKAGSPDTRAGLRGIKIQLSLLRVRAGASFLLLSASVFCKTEILVLPTS